MIYRSNEKIEKMKNHNLINILVYIDIVILSLLITNMLLVINKDSPAKTKYYS